MPDSFTEKQGQYLRSIGGYVVLGMAILAATLGATAGAQDYSIYPSWDAMDKSPDAKYATVTRVSSTVGYTGFWFFGAEQFDATDRYALAMYGLLQGPRCQKGRRRRHRLLRSSEREHVDQDRHNHRVELAAGLPPAMAP